MRQTDNALPYFDMMISETLRLCPPGENQMAHELLNRDMVISETLRLCP